MLNYINEILNILNQFKNKNKKKHENGGSGNGFQNALRWELVSVY